MITYNNNTGIIHKNGRIVLLTRKPLNLDIVYDSLYYEPETNNKVKVIGNVTTPLTEKECAKIAKFIKNYELPKETHLVTPEGVYAGFGINEDFTKIDSAPPSGGNYYLVDGVWTWVLAVDSGGRFLGNIPIDTTGVTAVDSTPENEFQLWDFSNNKWKDIRSIEQYLVAAYIDINKAVSDARIRYTTDIVGQENIYKLKLQEVDKYITASGKKSKKIKETDFPLTNAYALANGIDLDSAISLTNKKSVEWLSKEQEIEILRINVKAKLTNTETITEAKIIVTKVIAELSVL